MGALRIVFAILLALVAPLALGADDPLKISAITLATNAAGTAEKNGPNYDGFKGVLEVHKNGKQVALLKPEKRMYKVSRMPMTEAAIDAGFTRDLYAALGEQLDNGAWAVRIYYKPFVRWIWFGGVFMAIGELGEDSAAGKSILKTLQTMNKARDGLFERRGSTEAPALGENIEKARQDFDGEVAKVAREDKQGIAAAMSKVRTNSPELYAAAYPAEAEAEANAAE